MEVKLIISKPEYFDDYYSIRCGESDIYWMGHKSAPDYNMIRECYLSRLGNSPFVCVGDKKIYLISVEENKNEMIVGHIQLSINEDGIEIGISVLESCQGRGVGSRAIKIATDESLKYSDVVYARIRDDNFASQKAFYKNNFIRTEEYDEIDYPKVGVVKFRKYIYRKQ